jgi:Ca2+-binding RTX toxin-like protein
MASPQFRLVKKAGVVTKIKVDDGRNLVGTAGNDSINGGNGDDTLTGGDGADTLFGNDGEDFLYGGSSNDYLYGGRDSDYLNGGDGNDTLVGGGTGSGLFGSGPANDTLTGGNDADIFTGFREGNSTITDFQSGVDKISLSRDSIPAQQGVIDFAVADSRAAAEASNALLIYFYDPGSATGTLIYNANRNDPGLGGVGTSGRDLVSLQNAAGLNFTINDIGITG